MAEIIARAKGLAENQLESRSDRRFTSWMLKDICDDFDKLLNLPDTEQILFFCRQMKRLLDYNGRLSYDLWHEWREDIACIIDGPNGTQRSSTSWKRFLEKMELESKLMQRELQFQALFGSRKTFDELICEHEHFFKNYCEKYLSLHSKIPVQGLFGDIDDFLSKVYGITNISLNSEQRRQLQQKLQHLEIDFDCSNKTLKHFEINIPQNHNRNNFLPSHDQTDMIKNYYYAENIQEVLKSNRWIVILGEPGSGKSSLLRWIASHFSKEFISIPILVRIGEFAAWLTENPTSTKNLMDYINWLSKYVYHDDGKSLLKKTIDHGHALILLDGLDEVPDLEQRKTIVHLVKQFIDEFVRTSDFISAFDDKIITKDRYLYILDKTIEAPLPSQSNGNQIVITSRFVGYSLDPIIGPYIEHYSLALMEEKEAREFAEQWMNLVEENMIEILNRENIQLNEERKIQVSKQRVNSIASMFKMKSKLLMSNPWLLSLICNSVFQSTDKIYFNSRVELYDHIVQTSFSARKIRQLNIPKNVFIDFLIDLATYLHINSQSGLIDEYDIKLLCRWSLQKARNQFDNRRTLIECADNLINLLDSSLGFIAERGLQIYGFQHLSFQEYFVAQGLVRNFSIENIAKRILSFTIDPRFHESIILAVGWISFNRSSDDYDQFCQYLVTTAEEYSIPFGTILIFDAFSDIKILPSKAVIITALNKLFYHPSNLIVATYFFWNLSKLPDDIIIEWIQSSLKDDQSISKFCQCLIKRRDKKSDKNQYIQKLPTIVYQELWTFHNRNLSIEFDIDQVLRTVMLRDNITDQIFNQDFASYLSSSNNCLLNIHPLILAVLIAVCGGLYYTTEEDYTTKKNMLKIFYSTKKMHRESVIFLPMIEYLRDNQELNTSHIQSLIEYYEKYLDDCLPSDISSVIVDTFIALICLKGLSQTSFYQKYENYQALPLVLERLKSNWFHFMLSGQCLNLGRGMSNDTSFIESEVETILAVSFSQSDQSDEQKQSFSLACTAALSKLRIFRMKGLSEITNSRYNQIDQQNLLILFTCLPQSLQKLYSCSIKSSTNRTYSLPLVVFLAECLNQVDHITGCGPMIPCAVSILKPLLMKHSLENYALAIFREKFSDISWFVKKSKECDRFFLQKSFNWARLINEEYQRIDQNQNTKQDEEKDLRFFTASISLARILQAQYRSNNSSGQSDNTISSIESEKIHFALTNIYDPVLRIIAISIILNMNDPMIFHIEQKHQLRDETIGLFYSLLPNLPLSTLTYLFIRCFREQLYFPELFEEIYSLIGKKLNETVENQQNEEQEAAFVALRQLHDPDLSDYLTEFAKKTNNLSNILQLNSAIFYHYLNNTTTFQPCHTHLLSLMYLIELTFDVEILQIYIKDHHEEYVPSILEVLDQLWSESSECQRIMTFEIAVIITKNLRMMNKRIIGSIIGAIFQCVSIEKQAIPVIKHWLNYKTHEDFNSLAQYAALELIINGSNIAGLIDIVNEMFLTNNCDRLIFVAERLFNSPSVDLTILRQILVALNEKKYASHVSVRLNRLETLELILNVELQQVTTNIYRPFLLMINSCSIDLQSYLLGYLVKQFQLENSIKEEYIGIIVKWIIELLIQNDIDENLLIDLYEYIFTLLHNSQFPRIQKAIINALDSVFYRVDYQHIICLQDDIIKNFERIIDHWQNYPENILAVCLLSYGSYLVRLQVLQQNFNISNRIEENLTDIYKNFFPEILSIRAGFCLIFSKDWKLEPISTISWFKKEHDIQSGKEFEILLQKTMYTIEGNFYGLEDITEHLNMYPQSIDIFVIHLYDYLSNENIADRVPNYVRIAESMQPKHAEIFCNAVRNSYFGEKEFKIKLYNCFEKNRTDRTKLIYIYSLFGIVTVELLEMLESVKKYFLFSELSLINFKQISDGDAIQKLFSLLNEKQYHLLFKNILFILKRLVKANAISLLEVHQKLRLNSNVLYESRFEWDSDEEKIFDLLMNTSCFENDKATLHAEKTFTTKNDIDNAFEEEMARSDKKLHLPCNENSSSGSFIPTLLSIRHI